MTRLMKNFRKAQKGEIHCKDCRFYSVHPLEKRGRCGTAFKTYTPAVGKMNTCDAAEQKTKLTLMHNDMICLAEKKTS